jgi:hypothetical protein
MLEEIFWTGLHQRVVQLEDAVRIGSYVASKARYTWMTDSAQVVQTTDEKHSGKRVKPYVKPSTCNGPARVLFSNAVCLPVLKHGPRSLLLRAKKTVRKAGYWGESTPCLIFQIDLLLRDRDVRILGKWYMLEFVRRDPKDGDLFPGRLKCWRNSGGGPSWY